MKSLFGTFLHRLNFHRSVMASFISPVFGLVAGALLVDCFGSPAVHADSFLPDDAEVACRAILPQCFRRSDWAELCARDPSVADGHPQACRAAGFESGNRLQGR